MCILSSAPARNQSCYRCCYRTQFHPFLSPTSHASGERSFDPGSTPYHSLTLSHLVYIYVALSRFPSIVFSGFSGFVSCTSLPLSHSPLPSELFRFIPTIYRARLRRARVCVNFSRESGRRIGFSVRAELYVCGRVCVKERERERAGKKDDTL